MNALGMSFAFLTVTRKGGAKAKVSTERSREKLWEANLFPESF
ncbi:MAG: hypothetical protein ACXU9I_05790 [Syntrophales bacterium]